MTTAENNQNPSTPLTWTSSKVWGTQGLTHSATVAVADDEWTFVLDSPYKGVWVVRGWKNRVFDLYREARTLKDAKALTQQHVDQQGRRAAEAASEAQQDEPDVIGTLPDGRTVVADHKTGADHCQCEPAPHREDDGTYSHSATCPVAEAQQAAWQAKWDSRPIGSDVSDLIEIVPIPAAEGVAQMSAPLATAAEGMAVMAAAVARVQAARDRVQFRKDTCGCRTPLHTMRCGAGGRVRVVVQGGAA